MDLDLSLGLHFCSVPYCVCRVRESNQGSIESHALAFFQLCTSTQVQLSTIFYVVCETENTDL